ncbi:MAG TPA: Hsp20/alpha crystallin family protein [Candidatus Eisenbacteria bacterium]|jgi:HSP20 family protein
MMTLMRWNPTVLGPFRERTSLNDEMDRLFESFFDRGVIRGDVAPLSTPAVDIEETADAFVVRADLPGMTQKDVKVNLMGDTLTIRGERKREDVQKNGKSLHRAERVYGTFERSFTFGTPVRGDGVTAQYRDGVLEVRVPKAEEARVREIAVDIAS